MSAQHTPEPMAAVAELFICFLRRRPDGSRWPVGTKLYADTDFEALRDQRDELLLALEMLLDWHVSQAPEDEEYSAVRDARGAIAKATGSAA